MTRILVMLVGLEAGCGAEEAAKPPPDAAPDAPPPEGEAFADPGGRSPPIPADNPGWEWDAGGFVSDARWYGEHSWADVRMRVAGHLTSAGRDRARVLAMKGDLTAAAAAYADLARRLDAIPTPTGGVSRGIVAALRDAAQRDAALVGALAAGQLPAEGPGLAGLRARYLALAIRHRQGEDVSPEARALQEDLKRFVNVDSSLDIDSFDDFDDRHQLRVRLVEAYVDALDPLGLEERWGYWRPTEVRRQALILGLAAASLGGEDWSWKRSGVVIGDLPTLPTRAPTRWPSLLSEALIDPDQAPDFTVEGLGWLPTGDTLIDTTGWPGPRAIGTLQRLGLDDEAHRARLEGWASTLDKALAARPGDVPGKIDEYTRVIDAFGHGSRYYNIKQLRNDAVRQLARADRPDLALDVLRRNRPLHNQDWSCPNREGILLAVEGRLRAESGDLDRAIGVLEASMQASDTFLRDVDAAERAGPGKGPGKRPPTGPAIRGGPQPPPGSDRPAGGPPPRGGGSPSGQR